MIATGYRDLAVSLFTLSEVCSEHGNGSSVSLSIIQYVVSHPSYPSYPASTCLEVLACRDAC